MINTGQALPLVFTRFLCPRISRGEDLKSPRDSDRSWPRPRQSRELEQSLITTQTQTIRVREQSMSALSPCPRARLQTVRIRERIKASTVRKHALDADTACPRTIHSPELSASANSSRTRTHRKPGLAKNCPRQCMVVSMWLPTYFPVRIRMIPPYVLI